MKCSLTAFVPAVVGLFCFACDGVPPVKPADPVDCTPDGEKEFVHDVMSSIYLWADKTPDVDLSELTTPQEVLQAMAYRPPAGKDRWSSIVELAPYVAYFQHGEAVEFGYSTVFDAEGQLRVNWVVKNSPAGMAGLTRGATILEIGGHTIRDISDNGLWSQVLGPNEKGAAVVHRIKQVNGDIVDLTITKDVVVLDRVPVVEVIPSEGGDIGYLLYMGFVAPSEADLRAAFDQLRMANVKSLIVDLRYNGGGYVYLAGLLGSLIGGPDLKDSVLLRNTYNPEWSRLDSEMKLTAEPQAVGATKVVFLTSGDTASASELLINGLQPLLDVKLVGERTYGKPVGADVWQPCDLAITVITFRSLNTMGQGDYFEGLPVDCEVPDDLDHELGDPKESRLRQALALLTTGRCIKRPDARQLTVPVLDVERARRQLEDLLPAEMNPMR